MPTKYTAEDKKAYAEQKREEQRKMLADALTKLTSSEGWHRYLRTRARFHKYSFSNVILIALQKPEATQVAGAAKWRKEFKRTITEGEKAIYILAPQIVYFKNEKTGKPEIDANGRKVINYIWYKSVAVFDISQTEGDPVPEIPYEPLTGESHEEYLYRAEQMLNSLGYKLEVDAWFTGDSAFKVSGPHIEEGVVKINGSLAVNAQVVDAIRALVNRLLVQNEEEELTRSELSTLEESAVYLACLSVGLDTAGMTVPHIASWGDIEEDPKQVLSTLKEFAGKIDSLAKAVEEGIS